MCCGSMHAGFHRPEPLCFSWSGDGSDGAVDQPFGALWKKYFRKLEREILKFIRNTRIKGQQKTFSGLKSV